MLLNNNSLNDKAFFCSKPHSTPYNTCNKNNDSALSHFKHNFTMVMCKHYLHEVVVHHNYNNVTVFVLF